MKVKEIKLFKRIIKEIFVGIQPRGGLLREMDGKCTR